MNEKFQEWNIRKQKILDIPSTKLAQIGVSCNVKVVTSKTIGLSESQISRLNPSVFSREPCTPTIWVPIQSWASTKGLRTSSKDFRTGFYKGTDRAKTGTMVKDRPTRPFVDAQLSCLEK